MEKLHRQIQLMSFLSSEKKCIKLTEFFRKNEMKNIVLRKIRLRKKNKEKDMTIGRNINENTTVNYPKRLTQL